MARTLGWPCMDSLQAQANGGFGARQRFSRSISRHGTSGACHRRTLAMAALGLEEVGRDVANGDSAHAEAFAA